MSQTGAVRLLSYQDRCDRCGARAQALVFLHSGNELMFCQHHFNQHKHALVDAAAGYTSEREDPEPLF